MNYGSFMTLTVDCRKDESSQEAFFIFTWCQLPPCTHPTFLGFLLNALQWPLVGSGCLELISKLWQLVINLCGLW